MVLEGFAASYLAAFLGDYVEEINTEQLQVRIRQGTAKLENLELNAKALNGLNLPFNVLGGRIASAAVDVPWKVWSKPCTMVIKGVRLRAGPLTESAERRAISLKRADLARATAAALEEAEHAQRAAEAEKYSKSFKGRMFKGILEQMEVTLEDIEVSYEDAPVHAGGRDFRIGVTLDRAVLRSAGAMGLGAAVKKALGVQNFSVWWEPPDGRRERQRVMVVCPATASLQASLPRGNAPVASRTSVPATGGDDEDEAGAAEEEPSGYNFEAVFPDEFDVSVRDDVYRAVIDLASVAFQTTRIDELSRQKYYAEKEPRMSDAEVRNYAALVGITTTPGAAPLTEAQENQLFHMESKYPFSALRDARVNVVKRQHAEREVATRRKPKESWGAWASSWLPFTGRAAPEITEAQELEAELRAMAHVPAEAEHSTEPDTWPLRVHVSLPAIRLSLASTADGITPRSFVEARLRALSVEFVQRPEGRDVTVSIGGVALRDLASAHSLFPTIFECGSVETMGVDNAISLSVESIAEIGPASERPYEHRIVGTIAPITATLVPKVTQYVQPFLRIRPSPMLKHLAALYREKMDQWRNSNLEVFRQHARVSMSMSFGGLGVVIPSDPARVGTPVLIAAVGSAACENVLLDSPGGREDALATIPSMLIPTKKLEYELGEYEPVRAYRVTMASVGVLLARAKKQGVEWQELLNSGGKGSSSGFSSAVPLVTTAAGGGVTGSLWDCVMGGRKIGAAEKQCTKALLRIPPLSVRLPRELPAVLNAIRASLKHFMAPPATPAVLERAPRSILHGPAFPDALLSPRGPHVGDVDDDDFQDAREFLEDALSPRNSMLPLSPSTTEPVPALSPDAAEAEREGDADESLMVTPMTSFDGGMATPMTSIMSPPPVPAGLEGHRRFLVSFECAGIEATATALGDHHDAEPAGDLARLTVQGVQFSCTGGGSMSFSAGARLRGFSIDDCRKESDTSAPRLYRTLVSTPDAEDFIHLVVVRGGEGEGAKWQADLATATIQAVYLKDFVAAVTAYVSALAGPGGGSGVKMGYSSLPVMSFNVTCGHPIITLPLSASGPEAVVLNLGQTRVGNAAITLIQGQPTLERMQMIVEGVRVQTTRDRERFDDVLEPMKLNASLQRVPGVAPDESDTLTLTCHAPGMRVKLDSAQFHIVAALGRRFVAGGDDEIARVSASIEGSMGASDDGSVAGDATAMVPAGEAAGAAPSAPAAAPAAPPRSVIMTGRVSLDLASFTLVLNPEDTLVLEGHRLSGQVTQQTEAVRLGFQLGSVNVRHVSRLTHYPDLVTSRIRLPAAVVAPTTPPVVEGGRPLPPVPPLGGRKIGQPLFMVDVVDSKTRTEVSAVMAPLDVVYNPALMRRISLFFVVPYELREALARFQAEKEEAIREGAVSRLERMGVSLDLAAPLIMIPRTCEDAQSPLVLIDFGRFVLSPSQVFASVKEGEATHATVAYALSLHALQISVAEHQEQLRFRPSSGVISPVDCMRPFDAQLQLEYVIPLRRLHVNTVGETPLLNFSISDTQIRNALTVWEAVQAVQPPPPPPPPSAAERRAEHKRQRAKMLEHYHVETSQKDLRASLAVPSPPRPSTARSPTRVAAKTKEPIDILCDFHMSTMSLTLRDANGDVFRSALQGISLLWSRRNKRMDAALVVRTNELYDCLQGRELTVDIRDEEQIAGNVGDFIFTATMLANDAAEFQDPSSPLFKTQTSCEMWVDPSRHYAVHPGTVVSLMALLQRAFVGKEAPPPEEPHPGAPPIQEPPDQGGVVKWRVVAHWRQFSFSLFTDLQPGPDGVVPPAELACVTVRELEVEWVQRPPTWLLHATLGPLGVQDMTSGQPEAMIFETGMGPDGTPDTLLAHTFDEGEKQTALYPGTNMSVKVVFGRSRVLVIPQFINTAVKCFARFHVLTEAISSSVEKLSEATSQGASQVAFALSMTAPLVLIPDPLGPLVIFDLGYLDVSRDPGSGAADCIYKVYLKGLQILYAQTAKELEVWESVLHDSFPQPSTMHVLERTECVVRLEKGMEGGLKWHVMMEVNKSPVVLSVSHPLFKTLSTCWWSIATRPEPVVAGKPRKKREIEESIRELFNPARWRPDKTFDIRMAAGLRVLCIGGRHHGKVDYIASIFFTSVSVLMETFTAAKGLNRNHMRLRIQGMQIDNHMQAKDAERVLMTSGASVDRPFLELEAVQLSCCQDSPPPTAEELALLAAEKAPWTEAEHIRAAHKREQRAVSVELRNKHGRCLTGVTIFQEAMLTLRPMLCHYDGPVFSTFLNTIMSETWQPFTELWYGLRPDPDGRPGVIYFERLIINQVKMTITLHGYAMGVSLNDVPVTLDATEETRVLFRQDEFTQFLTDVYWSRDKWDRLLSTGPSMIEGWFRGVARVRQQTHIVRMVPRHDPVKMRAEKDGSFVTRRRKSTVSRRKAREAGEDDGGLAATLAVSKHSAAEELRARRLRALFPWAAEDWASPASSPRASVTSTPTAATGSSPLAAALAPAVLGAKPDKADRKTTKP